MPAKIDPVEPPLGFGLIQAADLTDWDGDTRHAEFDYLSNLIILFRIDSDKLFHSVILPLNGAACSQPDSRWRSLIQL